MEAQADDDEMVQRLVGVEPAGPQLSEWSPVRSELTLIADRLGELIALTLVASGGPPLRIPPRPRPTTALDRHSARRREQAHRALVARLLPGR